MNRSENHGPEGLCPDRHILGVPSDSPNALITEG